MDHFAPARIAIDMPRYHAFPCAMHAKSLSQFWAQTIPHLRLRGTRFILAHFFFAALFDTPRSARNPV